MTDERIITPRVSHRKELTPNQQRVLDYVTNILKAGGSFPGSAQIAKDTGIHDTSVRDILTALSAYGYLHMEPRMVGKNFRKSYRLARRKDCIKRAI